MSSSRLRALARLDSQRGSSMQQQIDVVLEEVATSVEERFTRAYNPDKADGVGVVSLGWWLEIRRLGLGLWIGKERPSITSGDTLRITISRKGVATEAADGHNQDGRLAHPNVDQPADSRVSNPHLSHLKTRISTPESANTANAPWGASVRSSRM
jgi:hypothetical protein